MIKKKRKFLFSSFFLVFLITFLVEFLFSFLFSCFLHHFLGRVLVFLFSYLYVLSLIATGFNSFINYFHFNWVAINLLLPSPKLGQCPTLAYLAVKGSKTCDEGQIPTFSITFASTSFRRSNGSSLLPLLTQTY